MVALREQKIEHKPPGNLCQALQVAPDFRHHNSEVGVGHSHRDVATIHLDIICHTRKKCLA